MRGRAPCPPGHEVPFGDLVNSLRRDTTACHTLHTHHGLSKDACPLWREGHMTKNGTDFIRRKSKIYRF